MELVLNTFGTMLNRDNECFVVSNDGGRQRVPVEGISSILVCKGVSLTSDAVLLAIDKGIEIHFMDRKGSPMGMVWSHRFGSISTIRKGQLLFTQSSDALQWIKGVIVKKIENQQALLMMTMAAKEDASSAMVDHAIAHLDKYRNRLMAVDGDLIIDAARELRGLEGISSKIYFDTINQTLPEHYRFKERSQHPAMDVANALLNYGYGLLYGKVESGLIKAGIDPYIGVLHRDEYNRPVLVYDVIELYRVWIDYVVFSLLAQEVVTEDYYSHREDGSCWLEGLGRRVIIQSVNDYLDEVVTHEGINRSRGTLIDIYCQDLAQKFKHYHTSASA